MNHFGLLVDYLWFISLDYLKLFEEWIIWDCLSLRAGAGPDSEAAWHRPLASALASEQPRCHAGGESPCALPGTPVKESKRLLTALAYGPSPRGPTRSMKRVYSVTQHFTAWQAQCGTQAHAPRATAHWLVLMAVVRVWAESEPCKQTRRLSSVIPQ